MAVPDLTDGPLRHRGKAGVTSWAGSMTNAAAIPTMLLATLNLLGADSERDVPLRGSGPRLNPPDPAGTRSGTSLLRYRVEPLALTLSPRRRAARRSTRHPRSQRPERREPD